MGQPWHTPCNEQGVQGVDMQGMLAGTTTNQDAYKAYEVHPREQHHVDYTYNPTPFEGSTESHDAFKQWQLEKRAAPPSPPMRISLPFEGKLTLCDLTLDCIVCS